MDKNINTNVTQYSVITVHDISFMIWCTINSNRSDYLSFFAFFRLDIMLTKHIIASSKMTAPPPDDNPTMSFILVVQNGGDETAGPVKSEIIASYIYYRFSVCLYPAKGIKRTERRSFEDDHSIPFSTLAVVIALYYRRLIDN